MVEVPLGVLYGGIMKRVTADDILKFNNLYFQFKNFAEVARQTGFSASTVRKYVDVNWKPVVSESIIKFDMNDLPEFDTTCFKHVGDYGAICILDDEEIAQIHELWKELAV